MNRRKERVPYAHPSCCAQRTRLNVHRTLARVQLCVKTLQMTLTIRKGETMKQHVRGHMPRDGSAVKTGNAGSKAQSSYYRDVRGSDQTSLLPEVSTRTPGS